MIILIYISTSLQLPTTILRLTLNGKGVYEILLEKGDMNYSNRDSKSNNNGERQRDTEEIKKCQQ